MKTLIILAFFTLALYGCKSKNVTAEHGIETDRELMTRNVTCDGPYKLVVMDSIGQSPDSPYVFYYPDKYNGCNLSSITITKLQTDTVSNQKYVEVYFGQHRYQTLYTETNNEALHFSYCGYMFSIKKDTVLVK